MELKNLKLMYPNLVRDYSNIRINEIAKDRNSKKIHYIVPMLSLESIFHNSDFLKFDDKIKKILSYHNDITYCCELKLDGVAVNIIYINGRLNKISTRGNGNIGEDITHTSHSIRNLPLNLKSNSDLPSLLEIRGEVLMLNKEFQRLNKINKKNKEKTFSNPRNATSGSLFQKDSFILSERSLTFYCYGVGYYIGGNLKDSQWGRLQQFKEWRLPVNDYSSICIGYDKVIEFYRNAYNKRTCFDFNIDGIVIKVDSIKMQDRIGLLPRFPRWAVAYKFPSKEGITKIEDIKFQVGRTGIITPVAKIKPIEICGVIIKSVTLHNVKEIERLGIMIGDKVVIKRSGDVVPKIENVVLTNRSNYVYPVDLPLNCPICNSKLEYERNTLKCISKYNCVDQRKKMLEHFVSKKAMNIIGIGSKIISKLVDYGLVTNVVDLFKLNENDFKKTKLAKEKLSKKLVNSIEKSKNTTLSRFIYALGIKEVGEITAINLANYYKTINNLVSAEITSLMKVKNIGRTVASEIENFFSKKNNLNIINNLLCSEVGINFYDKNTILTKNKNHPLFRKKIVLTGKFKLFSQDDIRKELMFFESKVINYVSSDTDLIIIGERPGIKLIKALKLGISTLYEYQFIKLLNK